MAGNLRLQGCGTEVMPFQAFSQALTRAVRAVLQTSLITDRIIHIRALIILSLYAQPSSADDADLPSQLGSQAIHHAHTLGLHLLKDGADDEETELGTLFCAVWVLDRLNGAIYGRPCLIHERDVGLNFEEWIQKCAPCFRLLLLVVQWLDKVTELYRPGPSAAASSYEHIAFIDLPVLEKLIIQAGALGISSSLIGWSDSPAH
jgi:hypothetical protein